MRTVPATETAVSIWFSREDVPDREQMLKLIRQALLERGLDPWRSTEAECFAAGEDTLVIARPGHIRRPAFHFDDLESLLSGVTACAAADSSLYNMGQQGYLLTVDPEAAGAALYEYGQADTVTADWEAHAREQGLCLIRDGAISDLRRYFSP